MKQVNIVECNKCRTEWHETVLVEKDTNSTTFNRESVECPRCKESEDFTLRPDYVGSSFNNMLKRLAGED